MNNQLRLILFLFVFSCLSCKAQSPEVTYCQNEKYNALVAEYINFDIPVISVQSLQKSQSDYIILDAREREEYELSHIPGALFIGYKQPDFNIISEMDKSKDIVVYCSIGYRSEKIGVKLSNMGFSKVYNLYGSIFEWANQDFPLVNSKEEETISIHGYNKKWSKWIENKKLKIEY